MGSRLDYSPLFRSTVGFDRLMNLLESSARVDEAALGFPPCNIEKLDDHNYRVSMAVAGFSQDDLQIETRDNNLIVSGKKEDQAGERTWLYHGIAARPFQRSFQLADFMKVTGAHLDHGILHIDLVREVPEEMKPRRIDISTGSPGNIVSKARKLVEGKKTAA